MRAGSSLFRPQRWASPLFERAGDTGAVCKSRAAVAVAGAYSFPAGLP